MKTCYVITPLADAAALNRYPPQTGDVILCADGGYERAKAMGLQPDLVLGDFDSMDLKAITDCAYIQMPAHKDVTDTFACIEKGIELGCEKYYIVGAFGGRLDHALANIQLMAWGLEKQLTVIALDALHDGFMLCPGRHEIARVEDAYISFFAHSEYVRGLHLAGVQYPLNGIVLDNRFALCVSNAFTSEKAIVTFDEGVLLCIIARKQVNEM